MSQPHDNAENEVSLDALSAAYAEAMHGESPQAEDPESLASDDTADAPSAPPPEQADEDSDDACELSPRTILEAMLFVGNRENEPLDTVRAASLMRGVDPSEIADLVADLNRQYAENGNPYVVVRDAQGYRMTLRREFEPTRKRFYGRVREAKLSQAAIDVLAIVAYRQPLTGEQVSRFRGQPSGHILSQLVRRHLLELERNEEKRSAAVYRTTDRFLELFDLASLDDLPRAEEVDG